MSISYTGTENVSWQYLFGTLLKLVISKPKFSMFLDLVVGWEDVLVFLQQMKMFVLSSSAESIQQNG